MPMPSLNLSRWILPLKAVPAMALALLTGLAMAAEPAAEPAASCPPPFSPPTPAEVQAMAPHMQDRGLLWRVQDGERTSWLYGTLHVGKREWILPGRTIVRSMYGADLLALELDVLNPQVMQQLIDGFQARVDAPALPAELEARLAQHRKQACAEHLSTQRPDAQLLGLVSQLGRKQGLVAEFGADLLLAGMAHALHKPVLGLESAQTQLEELLSDDPLEVQESVRDGLDQLDDPKAPEILQQLANIWASGNETQLENYADWCDCIKTERDRLKYARLMDGRNPGMADGIVRQLQQGKTVFAAVGALHMIGPKGLPELLRQKGYQVERVSFKPPPIQKSESKPIQTE
ncbi:MULTISPECIES: TraB/GumN family protein [Comamonas]|uniref:TraB/GumN family protein n=1 Tax=Comamonas TaxID=283 RepID=UPI0001DA7090|nr:MULTISPECIES: TraB/GumN family protein [Comamonas]EFI60137.1 GumN [Comamonas thiooxydans]TFF61331.1 TraB/GumN family protein [Comamonas sp. A23]